MTAPFSAPVFKFDHVWTCPPITCPTSGENQAAARLFSAIAKRNPAPAGPIGVAGLELRAAMMLLHGEPRAPEADNDFWAAKCRSLLLRPAIEPIACSYWARFAQFRIDEVAALGMASAMAGRSLVPRKGPATGRSVHGDVGFERLDVAAQWLSKIVVAAGGPELGAALPGYCFAQTIMAHPFSDGNGRFARLMVHAALARCAGIERPVIALAPAFYRRARELGAALTALSADADWSAFNATFLSILEDALTLTRLLHRRSR